MAAHCGPIPVGKKFGRLIVIGVDHSKGTNKYARCQCKCGKLVSVYRSDLNTGKTKSCGCLRSQLVSAKLTLHGMTDSPEYRSWKGMRLRCNDPNNIGFKHYGARGVKVCKRWQHSFENFLADMGIKPRPRMSIDRIDCEGNYTPSNCRWATYKEQARNKRTR